MAASGRSKKPAGAAAKGKRLAAGGATKPAKGRVLTGEVVKDAKAGAQTVEPAATVTDDAAAGQARISAAPVAAAQNRGGFVPLVLGGVVAGAVGFGAAMLITNQPAPVQNELDFQKSEAAIDDLTAAVDAQQGDLERLGALVAAADTVPVDALGARLDRMDQTVTALAASVEELTRKLGGLENRPAAAPDGNGASVSQQDLAALGQSFQQELALLQTQIATREESLQAVDVALQAALAEVQKRVQSGGPFADPLLVLQAAGVEVSAALLEQADIGVATLATLQEAFPEAARTALATSIRADVDAGKTSKISGFLRTQLGARSLDARDGDDPDAVLSRAEAAVRRGDIGAAIDQLASLPADGVAAMQSWTQLARARLWTIGAVSNLAGSMGN